MITKKQFDVLVYLAEHSSKVSQRSIAQGTGLSVGAVNKIMAEFSEKGSIVNGMITEQGCKELEPYRVKRAIFIAAGFGSRLAPITFNTPKPLVRVKGQRIIDGLIDAVLAQGIDEIYIVRGYLGEQFDQLLYKYPMIQFIENPVYNEANNISSVYCARYFLKNAYVLEADLLLYNPALIKKYQYASNYLGVPVEKTDDWCLEVRDGYISKLAIGGTNCYHLFGISYWTEEDGGKLAEDIKDVYEAPGGKERYWDQAALEYHLDRYKVAVRECSFEDLTEIDTFNELKKIDKTYDM